MKENTSTEGERKMIDTDAKRRLAIKQIRQAADNLYKSADISGVNSPEWKAARVLNSLSNALEFQPKFYSKQLRIFMDDFFEVAITD